MTHRLDSALPVGTTIQKIKGHRFPGVIVAAFAKLDGSLRYVAEADHPEFEGLLFIFAPDQIAARPITPADATSTTDL